MLVHNFLHVYFILSNKKLDIPSVVDLHTPFTYKLSITIIQYYWSFMNFKHICCYMYNECKSITVEQICRNIKSFAVIMNAVIELTVSKTWKLMRLI